MKTPGQTANYLQICFGCVLINFCSFQSGSKYSLTIYTTYIVSASFLSLNLFSSFQFRTANPSIIVQSYANKLYIMQEYINKLKADEFRLLSDYVFVTNR